MIPENESTGIRKLRFDLGDGTPRFYQFQVEDFMPERMALEITGKKAFYSVVIMLILILKVVIFMVHRQQIIACKGRFS